MFIYISLFVWVKNHKMFQDSNSDKENYNLKSSDNMYRDKIIALTSTRLN